MSYIILARKYRPKIFEEMVGQKPVVQTLMNAIKNNRVAQAYIFSGMRGVGKTTAARIFAKALNCKSGPIPTPCNKCEFCEEITNDHSVDVIEIDGAANRRVEEARSLREGLKYKPIHSRYKVVIIDEVHMLTNEAFNTLLKILEEPPENTVFIFATTEFHKVPQTIVSRCQHFEFKKISMKDIINHLLYITKKENIIISSSGLNMIAEAADGSLRDAQSLLDQAVAFSGESISDDDLMEILGTIKSETLFQFSEMIIQGKSEKAFSLVENVIDSGYDLPFFYKELTQHFRNLLLVKSVKNVGDLLSIGEDDLNKLKKQAEKLSSEEILRYLLALQEGEPGLKYSSHQRFYLEALLVKLCHFKRIIPLEDIIAEIEYIKKEVQKSAIGQSKSVFQDNNIPKINESNSFFPTLPLPENKKIIRESLEDSNVYSDKQEQKHEVVKDAPEPRKTKNKDVDMALKDPSVQNFINTFKAQILSVEPIKKSKD